jgi:hypothetical protein
VDEVIALYEDHRKSESSPVIVPQGFCADSVCSSILGNTNQHKNQ